MIEERKPPTTGLEGLSPQKRALLARRLRERGIDPESFPLSFAQERLWFLDQLAPGNPFYNVPVAVRLSGWLDIATLERSLQEVARRHQSLRTHFPFIDKRPVQWVSRSLWAMPLVDLSGLPEEHCAGEASRLSAEEAARPFDLARGPVARALLLREAPEEHTLLVTLHHIVSDGWSMGVLVREVAALYEAFAEGRRPELPELPIQYVDFAAWQRRWLTGEVWERQMGYWRERLAGLQPLELPLDHRRPAVQRFHGERVPLRLEPEMAEGVRRLSQRQGATPFITLLAAFVALLARHTGQTDVAVGTPIANRNRIDVESLIGFFVNSLVMRTDASGDPAFAGLIARVREVALGAYAHQDLPFEKLVEELQPERSTGQNPLFQVVFALQNAPVSEVHLTGLRIEPMSLDNETAKFDLKLDLWEVEEGIYGAFRYDTDLFERATAERLAERFGELVADAVRNPQRRLGELELLSPEERRLLTVEWNGSWPPVSAGESLVARFASQVARTPEAVAVVYGNESLGYAELWQRSLRVAGRLRSLGVEEGDLVGLYLERSLDLVVAIVGVLAAGGAYVPLDPTYPEERVSLVVDDAGLRWVLASASAGEGPRLPLGCRRVWIEEALEAETGAALVLPSPDSPAYVIYTSGSTGRPKGVVVTHGQVVRLFDATQEWFEPGPRDVWTLFHSYAFDFSVWEIWGALLNGGRLVVVPYWVSRQPEAFHDLLLTEQVTVLNQTPSAFRQLLSVEQTVRSGLPALRWVVFGGEALELSSLKPWWEAGLPGRLINMYGITETTVHVTWRPLGPEDANRGSRVGIPIPDLRVYVVGPEGGLCPIGVAGELWVAGAGVAQGYLGRPELTAQRFAPDPWSGVPGARLYRSGDLGRWTAEGDLEYLGRIDHQVKIRGFRIEPGEIEAALRGHPGVREVAVVAREDGSDQRQLVAYVVPAENWEESETQGGWSEAQVERWRKVFDQIYGSGEAKEDPTFNLVGWTSAESDEAIPAEQMREWLEETVESIRALAPRRVLEIGCGTGMVLFRVAPGCERYVGTDFSTASLSYVRAQAERLGLDQVELWHRGADELADIEPGSFDAVVINSVAQYFPDVEYLERVLTGAVKAVAPGGFVFVGDVRSLPLLRTQHLGVQLAKLESSAQVSLLEQKIRQQAAQETELIVAPELFVALTNRLPEIGHVEISPKQGRALNELTRFRYQVLLHIGPDRDDGKPGWLDWRSEGLSLASLERLLQEARPELLAVQAIPNARLRREAAALRLLASSNRPTTVGELRARLVNEEEPGVEPWQLEELGERLGYRVSLGWSEPGEEGRFEAGFQRADLPGTARLPVPTLEDRPLSAWANSPQRGLFARRLAPALRRHAEQVLPPYMVPAALVMLDQFPVTPQGKLDRTALPAPERDRPELEEGYVAPRTAPEEALARIWSEVLGLERVGVEDDFFHLGGHSLLATQVVSQVRETLGVELPLRCLFETPRISGLARTVQELQARHQAPSAPPIRRSSRRGSSPLSFAQERLWFLDRLMPGSSAYNEPFALMLEGRLDIQALEQALIEIVRRHESLRTRFPEIDGRPVQVAQPSGLDHLPIANLSGLTETACQSELARLRAQQARLGFDLQRGPLVRLALVRLDEQHHALLATLHHIVFDGWSTGVLVKELSLLYAAFAEGRTSPLPEPALQYADFAAWQREWLQGDVLERHLAYWKQQLEGVPPLELPTDRPRLAVQRFHGGKLPLALPPELAAALRNRAQDSSATLYMILLAGFQTLLGRLSGQTDVVVGSPIANRDRAETEGMIGFFVNMLALRADLSGDLSFSELIARVRDTALSAYAHQALPFEKLVDELRIQRDLARNPLFQVIFQLHTPPAGTLELSGLFLRPLEGEIGPAKFDLDLSLADVDGAVAGSIEFDRDLFDSTTVQRMAAQLERLLTAAAAEPGRRLSSVPLLGDAERFQVLLEWNDTVAAYPAEASIQELFEACAARMPEAPALVGGAKTVTYGELNRRANSLAWHLRDLGVRPDDRVCLLLKRGEETIVALLAILKAGGAYVPLDPSHPAERLAFLLADAEPRVVLIGPGLEDRLESGPWPVVLLPHDGSIQGMETDPPRTAEPDSLAYILYTSGSTGEPKGVAAVHRAVVRLVFGGNYAAFGPTEVFLQSSPVGFDASTLEIWGSLLHGGRLVMVPEARPSLAELGGLIARERVSVLWLTAALFEQMVAERMEDLRGVRQLLAGGDVLPPAQVRTALAGLQDGVVINGYGPTENTTFTCCHRMACPEDAGIPVPIGRAISNGRVYVLDAELSPVPIGVPGELCAAGDGLARGYWRRPDLTADRFVPDPFFPGARMYRTGDRVRLLRDGRVEFLGRFDEQVKLRGFRVEPGEIEAVLAGHPSVRQAVVLALTGMAGGLGERRLVAYVAPYPDEPAGNLREYLEERLPAYMVPSTIVLVEAMPQTPNGKVDRRALAALDAAAQEPATKYLPPRTPTEQSLAAIWSEVLGCGRVGAHDDFFILGGHSLLATRVASRVRTVFGLDLPLRSIFEASTLAELAATIDSALSDRAMLPELLLERVPRGPEMPLSYAQERLWFLDQLAPGNPFYNVPVAVRLRGLLDTAALEHSLQQVSLRHESLRTRFPSIGNRPVQWVSRSIWTLPVVDLSGLPEEHRSGEAFQLSAEEAARPFDLVQGPVARALLVREAPEEHALLVTLHHIVSDGWSMGVLVREVAALYEAFAEGRRPELPELPIQYVDFAAWQRRWLTGEVWERQMGYWRERLAGLQPLELPLDHRRPAVQRFRGGRVPLRLKPEMAEGLRRLSQQQGATSFMTLLAAFVALLARHTGQADVAVGTPIANRNRTDVEGLIGFFVNSLVMRTDASGDPSFGELIARAREAALGAYAHQDLPFEKLVEELQPERSTGQNPLFQVVFALQNAPVSEIHLTGLRIEGLQIENETSLFDLKLDLWETQEGIHGAFRYDTDLFERATAERLAERFGELAADAVHNPQRRLGELELLSPEERRLLTVEWNGSWPLVPSGQSLVERFAAQVARAPEAVAVVYGDEALSYGELWQRSLGVAGRLRSLGVEEGDLVGLYLERSLDLVVAIMGVLAAGGAYVPLDPSYPEERISLVVDDARLRWVLASASAGEGLRIPPGCLRVWIEETLEGETAPAPVLPSADSPAYVIYTSGSTGRPKGVVVPHGQVVRLFDATRQWFEPGPEDVWTLFHSYAFDFSVWEIWGALLYGGRLVVVPYWVSRQPEAFHALLVAERVTVLNQTPSAFRQLLNVEQTVRSGLPSLRWVVFGGEALELSSLKAWWEARIPGRLINMYGITETTVHVTYRPLGPEDAQRGSRIGVPIPDLRVYVVGPEGGLCPIGVAGELWVAGAGVAQGYLGRPELTAQRFAPDPWSGVPGARLYRSGDLGRWTAEGDLEYLGRIDHQVKIRGFRIEPGEIEAALRRHPGVREVAVVAREDGSDQRQLVAYVVPADNWEESEPQDGWSEGQVERWRKVFDQTYGSGEVREDPTFNLVGWTSAETDEAIPAEQMREWLEETVESIQALAPRRVLEIGCGTGMVLFRVAPGCERYVGTDFSTASLSYVRAQAERLGLDQVELWNRGADELDDIEPDSFDAVVINSVAQYFPDVEYLERVLTGAVRAVAPRGFVFVGDVRSLPLLRAQHLGVQLARLEASAQVSQLEQKVRQQAAQETELIVAPELFVALANRLPEIGRIEISPKRGHALNELTRFRYQVLLHIGSDSEAGKPGWLDWRAERLSLASLERLLQEARPELLAVRAIPNARLRREAAALRLLASPAHPATVGELRARLVSEEEPGVEPWQLEELGERLSYRVTLGWSEPGEQGDFEAGFQRADLPGTARLPVPIVEDRPLSAWANSPQRGLFARRLAPALRRHAEQVLPPYMVPAALVMLDQLPVTPQGKLDRKALPAPERDRPELEEGYVAPRTASEEALARIWSEVLGLERVGIEDDFFHLGGHSLLATQVVSQVRETLGVELPLRCLFETPRISGLARTVEELQARHQAPSAPPIRRSPRRGSSPLSFAQERLWFLDRLMPGSSAYNEPFALMLEGQLDTSALERALIEIVRRHESLRTRFPEVDGRPVQVAQPSGLDHLPMADLSGLTETARQSELARLRSQQARLGFDLQRGPLVRLALVRLDEQHHAMLATLHHIVFDGWSTGVLVRELSTLYSAFAEGRTSPLPEPALQYADFAAWQRDWLQGDVLERHLSYWKQQLEGAPPLELPTDRPRPAAQRFHGGKLPLALPAELAAALRNRAQESSATLYMILLAGFQTLLGRLSGQTDVVLGSPIANRDRAETEGMIGFFVNMLVLRADLSGDPSFSELIARIRDTALAAYAHQALPFEKLVDELRIQRDLARNPLFQATFQVVNTPGDLPCLPGIELRLAGAETGASKFDLDVSLWETEAVLAGVIEYDRDLFDRTTVQRLSSEFERLLAAAVANPVQRLSSLPLMNEAERFQVVTEWNDTDLDLPPEAALHRLFEKTADERPDTAAVIFGAERITYSQLERAANRLAHHLRELGIGLEERVALCVERSPQMLVALLGVLKAGGAYLPLDPSHPRERLAYLLADSGVRILLTEAPLLEHLPEHPGPIVCLDRDAQKISAASSRRPEGDTAPEALAYAIYTSGSTGAPKGVGVPHRAIVSFLASMRRRPGLEPGEILLAVTTLSFDIAALELFLPLAVGAAVQIVPREVAADGSLLREALSTSGATLLQATPSTWRMLRDSGWPGAPGLRALSGGEALPQDLADFLAGSCAACWNLYGPTETTVWSATARVESGKPVSLGMPIANTRIHLLDAAGEPVPPGASGALFIGGDGVARGYIARPDLTADRFVPDPFGGRPGARLYNTGDLARRRSDGSLEFLGRLDHQVKVRGYRVETGEIEAVLSLHPAVLQTVVVARSSGIDARLTGYVVPRAGSAPDPAELRGFLRGKLPEPMVPSRLVMLDVLPLTPNGKIDRRALPDPEPVRSAAGRAPRTAYEEGIAAVWEELLETSGVGPADGFFDLGGNSLVATRMLSRLRVLFGVELPLRTVFETPTLAEIASAVEAGRGGLTRLPPLVPLPPGAELPLSFAQERLWFLDRLVPDNPFYNMPAAVRIRGPLEAAVLAATLDRMRQRQSALRASFPDVQGRPALHINPAVSLPLPVVDLVELPAVDHDAVARTLAREEALRPFDLARGPIFRTALLRLAADHHVLLLTIHHIVSDGWSVGVLIHELRALYDALAAGTVPESPAPPVQYHDYAAWQRAWLTGAVLAEQLAFWRRRLSGELPVLRLPADRPRPAVQRFRGASHPFDLGLEATAALKALSRREGATLFMTLLASFQALLRRLTGQEDLVVGSPIANRRLPEVEGLVGFFVNTLAIRGNLAGDPTFSGLLARVREEALGAYAHQDIPFEKLVEELHPERDTSHNPIFQVLFVLQNAPLSALELGGLSLSLVPSGAATTRFDLTLELQETARGLTGSLQYSRDLFDPSTVARFEEHLKVLLAGIVANPAERISALTLLGPAELHQMRVEWNDTGTVFPPGEAIHRLFEEQAARTPEKVALEIGDECLSYRELNRRANHLARRLGDSGAGPEVRIGLCLERSVEMVVAILGVLKAGGVYVPLDPEYPLERLEHMIEACSAAILLTRKDGPAAGGRHGGIRIELEPGWGAAEPGDPGNPAIAVPDGAAAYVIFTSGSTGRPKGIVISHRALVNHMRWLQRVFPLGPEDAVLQKTPFSFDASVWEFYAPLLAGGRLVLARPGGHRDASYLVETMERHGITMLQLVPALLQMLLAEPRFGRDPRLRYIFCGGEALTPALAERFLARSGAELVNLYGPAEACIDSTYWICRRGEERAAVPIGRPVDNARAVLLDDSWREVPLGVAGELCMSGEGLARGYQGQPDLTAERFVPDPAGAMPGARLYRSRDLARYLPDGSLEFLGRIDGQVKLRGFRVELGEIESVLGEHPAVREAVAEVRGTGSDRRLVAWVVPEPERTESATPAGSGAPVEQWRKVFDETFRATSGEDESFNIVGWNSSYTGEPIPADEMREWLDATVERILSLRPARLLELGCGTGLLLFRIAPACERYLATDFSESALGHVRGLLEQSGEMRSRVTLDRRPADDFIGITPGSFDVVVLNSVAQYFPSLDYLLRVIEGAVAAVRPGGRVFLGDLRSLPLLGAFHASVQLARAKDDMPVSELRWLVQSRMAEEKELVLDPALFHALPRRFPRIGHVQILRKRGRYLNELTRFRYDVVLHVEPEVDEPQVGWRDWQTEGLDLDRLRRLLVEDAVGALALAGVPDARVAADLQAFEGLATSGGAGSAGELRRLQAETAGRGVDPEDLWHLAGELGYDVEVGEAGMQSPGRFDVFFHRTAHPANTLVRPPARELPNTPWESLANRPAQSARATALVTELRSFLKDRLPPFMVPSAFMVLDTLPLNPSGKVERSALPDPPAVRAVSAGEYAAPRDQVERLIAAVWQEVLGLDAIGVNDNFFDLGGHSLLVVQVHERLKASLGRELSMVHLFQYPTVASLAAFLAESAPAEGAAVAESRSRAEARRGAVLQRAQRGRAVRGNS